MTKSMTGSFYLTETITLPAAAVTGSRVQGTVDLGAYVNVPTGQAIAIEAVDFIWQRQETAGITYDLEAYLAATNGTLGNQLTDLNPGSVFIRADNQSLVALSNSDGIQSIHCKTSKDSVCGTSESIGLFSIRITSQYGSCTNASDAPPKPEHRSRT